MKKSLKIALVVFVALAILFLMHLIYSAMQPLPANYDLDIDEPQGENQARKTGTEVISLATKPLTLPSALIALGAAGLCVNIARKEE